MSRFSEKRSVAFALAAVAGVATAALGWKALGMRIDQPWLSPRALWLPVALLVALFLVGTAVLFLGRGLAAAALALALVGGLSLVATRAGFQTASPWADTSCLLWGGLLALVSTTLLLALLHRPSRPLGVVDGAAGGALAALPILAMLHLRCALGGASHGLVVHGGVLVLMTVIGALVGRRVAQRAAGAPQPGGATAG